LIFNFPAVLNHAILCTNTSKYLSDESGRSGPMAYSRALARATPPFLVYTEHPEIRAYVFRRKIY